MRSVALFCLVLVFASANADSLPAHTALGLSMDVPVSACPSTHAASSEKGGDEPEPPDTIRKPRCPPDCSHH